MTVAETWLGQMGIAASCGSPERVGTGQAVEELERELGESWEGR